ncbi:acyltransferase family protein [Sphingomonas abietis]|uniref:Acyltransferase n=1 Tax=Sphingomonas abietis TaxID=3012344 RepID=A0ABY7NHW0_9SPHN|nr:acyltransferase [Sphingomonas abietis]WBO20852.1 acyltransferase [Sphingomonas abietis]
MAGQEKAAELGFGRPAALANAAVPKQPSRTHNFATLDGLRGIAALAVVTFHYQDMLGPFVFRSAYLAVDLFFLMSGVVITHAYEHRLAQGMTVSDFMAKRIIRLMPLYLAGLGVGTAVAMTGLLFAGSGWTWGTLLPVVLCGALLLPNLFPAPRADLYPLDIPCWSLFWELLINLAYALSLRWLKPGMVIAMAMLAQAALAVAAWHAGGLDFGSNWQRPEIGLLRVAAGFSTGIVLARLLAAGRLWHIRMPPWLILIAASMLFALPTWLGWIKDALCVMLAFPLLCITALHSEPRWSKPYLWLGLVSYPLYVIHATLPWDRLVKIGHVSAESLAPWSGLLAIAGAVIVAWGLARFYDAPLRCRLARWGRAAP